MKLSLIIGVVLVVLGIGTALTGVFGVGAVQSGVNAADMQASDGSTWAWVMPVLSGLSLAVGALLIGLSMGNWRHPRSHTEPGDAVVNPEGHEKMKHV
jgi:hypothetical protein